nr:hypothetical protein OG781_12540 [Streptomyces sp. NBC_00830]
MLQLPVEEQATYAETFRRLTAFEALLTRAGSLGKGLVDDVGDRLAAGGLATTRSGMPGPVRAHL